MSLPNFPQELIPATHQEQCKNAEFQADKLDPCPPYSESKSNQPAVPVVQQPQGGVYSIDQNNSIPYTVGIPNCPPGLEYLASIDQLLVQQKVELWEAFTGFETNNKFKIKNSLGQDIFFAAEDTDCCTRQMCGPARPFDMKIMDIYKNEVIHFYRPFACCLSSIEVSAPPGNVIGRIEQTWSLCPRRFNVKNHNNETVLIIEGPFCVVSCCEDIDFSILSMNGVQVGKITKQWSGLSREMFTDADHFGINFPMDLDVRMKAVLLGACMLIDILFFETANN